MKESKRSAFSCWSLRTFSSTVLAATRQGDDGFSLADAVSAVDGLAFDGRVPPGVEDEDVIGFGEGQAGTGGLKAQEKHLGLVRILELLDQLLAFGDGS